MHHHLRSVSCGALLVAALFAGCQSSDDQDDAGDGAAAPASSSAVEPATPAASAETTGSGYSGPTIPQGLWTRHLTPQEARADARKLGLSDEELEVALEGAVTEDLAFSFKFEDGVWAQYQALDHGEATVGDSGTYTYDADGNLSTVSNSTGCPGCVGVVRWSVDGDELTLALLPGSDEDPVPNFVTDGTYQRES